MNTDALGWVGFGGSWEACAVTGFSCGERRIKAKTDSRGLWMGRVRRGPARLSRNSARPDRGEATGRCCRKLESAGPAVRALNGEELLSHGSDARGLRDEARAKGVQTPLMVHIPDEPDLASAFRV